MLELFIPKQSHYNKFRSETLLVNAIFAQGDNQNAPQPSTSTSTQPVLRSASSQTERPNYTEPHSEEEDTHEEDTQEDTHHMQLVYGTMAVDDANEEPAHGTTQMNNWDCQTEI